MRFLWIVPIGLILFFLTSCSQIIGDSDELQTMPVTNNPLIVPQHGGGMPMGSAH